MPRLDINLTYNLSTNNISQTQWCGDLQQQALQQVQKYPLVIFLFTAALLLVCITFLFIKKQEWMRLGYWSLSFGLSFILVMLFINTFSISEKFLNTILPYMISMLALLFIVFGIIMAEKKKESEL